MSPTRSRSCMPASRQTFSGPMSGGSRTSPSAGSRGRGAGQPGAPKLVKNFKLLNPFMVKAGQYKGKQYGVPADWGFDAILYRSDKVTPKAKSWNLLFDDRYKGRIAWFDDLNMLTIAGLYLGFNRPWRQSD